MIRQKIQLIFVCEFIYQVILQTFCYPTSNIIQTQGHLSYKLFNLSHVKVKITFTMCLLKIHQFFRFFETYYQSQTAMSVIGQLMTCTKDQVISGQRRGQLMMQ